MRRGDEEGKDGKEGWWEWAIVLPIGEAIIFRWHPDLFQPGVIELLFQGRSVMMDTDHVSHLASKGYVVQSNVVNPEACDLFQRYLSHTREKAIQLVVDGVLDHSYLLGEPLFLDDGDPCRAFFRLPLSEEVCQFLRAVLQAIEPLLNSFAAGGNEKGKEIPPTAALHELSTVHSFPGSQYSFGMTRRASDERASNSDAGRCTLLQVMCALQDVEEGMGPLIFSSGTHRAAGRLKGGRPTLPSGRRPRETILLKKGDVLVFDSRVTHSAEGNRSLTEMTCFYHSWRLELPSSRY
jgi:hypothetical protein